MSRLIDANALKRKAQRVATESWKMRLTARIETTLNQFIDWIDNAPTVQPEPSEITDEQAILHLQSTGWMQNHDREIYESGLKEQLADDSESYDSIIPYEDDEDTISRRAVIDALHTWFRDGFDEDKWWNSTHVLAAIEGLPSSQQGYKWETCFECPLSHGCPKIKGCTNGQANEYASQIPNDCPLSTQPKYEPVKAEDFAKTMSENTIYSFAVWYGTVLELIRRYGFTICKKTM